MVFVFFFLWLSYHWSSPVMLLTFPNHQAPSRVTHPLYFTLLLIKEVISIKCFLGEFSLQHLTYWKTNNVFDYQSHCCSKPRQRTLASESPRGWGTCMLDIWISGPQPETLSLELPGKGRRSVLRDQQRLQKQAALAGILVPGFTKC